MRIVFAGTPDVALPTLDALLASDHEVVAVLTRPDAPAGRGRRVTPSAVAEYARSHGIPVLMPASLADPDVQAELAELDADLGVVVAYGALIPAAVLGIPAHGWLNLHFSLLPAWRGAAPVQHAIWRGDSQTGVCVFQLDKGMDTGPVYARTSYPLASRQTTGEVLTDLAGIGAGVVREVVDTIAAGTAHAIPQSQNGVSRAPRITVQQARITWTEPGATIDRQIRACTPHPGAWTTIDGVRVRLGPVQASPGTDLGPGCVRAFDSEIRIGTGDGQVTLGWVQPAGKSSMSATDWWRGLRVSEARCD
ncbi:MAG: methionyl-tRNA formyltransferase [Actinobacteria bacterium]|nr:methionyl-tRNA formyltransferase [Actinomycetota bacterium]